MSETEKITINLGAVDLGKIDLLVDQGLYSNRADLIRTAIRRQLEQHADVVDQTVSRRHMAVGVLMWSASDLEAHKARGEKLRLGVVGMLILSSDVSAELASATIESIDVFGSFRASSEVKAALASRVHQLTKLPRRGSREEE